MLSPKTADVKEGNYPRAEGEENLQKNKRRRDPIEEALHRSEERISPKGDPGGG